MFVQPFTNLTNCNLLPEGPQRVVRTLRVIPGPAHMPRPVSPQCRDIKHVLRVVSHARTKVQPSQRPRQRPHNATRSRDEPLGHVDRHWRQQALLLEHRLHRRLSPLEHAVSFRRLAAVAAAVDVLTQPCRRRGIEDVAALEEGVEGVGVEYLGPEVDIVRGGVARGREEVQKVGRAVTHHDAAWHIEPLERLMRETISRRTQAQSQAHSKAYSGALQTGPHLALEVFQIELVDLRLGQCVQSLVEQRADRVLDRREALIWKLRK